MVMRVATLGRKQVNSSGKALRLNGFNIGNEIFSFAKA